MTSLSAAILVATCTATFGLHSSSSTTSSYSYFAFGSALRRRTARSAELRPPRPLTETPPVSGPMKPTLTLSLASAATVATANASAAIPTVIRRHALSIRYPLQASVLGIVARREKYGKPVFVSQQTAPCRLCLSDPEGFRQNKKGGCDAALFHSRGSPGQPLVRASCWPMRLKRAFCSLESEA